MTEHETLIQRFVDNDLSADERLEVLNAIDRDAGLRRQLINFQLVVAEAQRMPRLTPSRTFAARVRQQVTSLRPSLVERFAHWLVAPRALQWNWAGAMAGVLVILVVGWALSLTLLDRSSLSSMTAKGRQEPKVFVRLVFLEPQAESVTVVGDFNGWNAARTPLRRTEGGVWTTTVTLEPGRYEYMFLVDGKQWTTDPLAREGTDDGFGFRNAVLDVDTPL